MVGTIARVSGRIETKSDQDWLVAHRRRTAGRRGLRLGGPARLRRRRAVQRNGPRPRRGPRRGRAPHLRGLRGPGVGALRRDLRRDPPPLARHRTHRGVAPDRPARRRRVVGRHGRVRPAPGRGVRGRTVRDRRAQGVGADLEARGVGRRCRLGHRRERHHPSSDIGASGSPGRLAIGSVGSE